MSKHFKGNFFSFKEKNGEELNENWGKIERELVLNYAERDEKLFTAGGP